MLKIRNNQLVPFRMNIRREKRSRLLTELKASDAKSINETKDQIIITNKKGKDSILTYSDTNLLTQFTKPSGKKVVFKYTEDDRLNRIEFENKEYISIDINDKFNEDKSAIFGINENLLDIKYQQNKRDISSIHFPNKTKITFNYNKHELVSVTNRVNAKRFFEKNVNGEKKAHTIIDELGRKTTVIEDRDSGIEKIIYPDLTTQEVSYNQDENLEIVKLRNGKLKKIFYEDELTRVEWDDGSFQNVYTDNEEVVAIENQSGTIFYQYDEAGRLLKESFQNSEVEYHYIDSELDSIAYPTGLNVKYEYDIDGELAFIRLDNQTIAFMYNGIGKLEQVIYPNQNVEQFKNKILDGLVESRLSKRGELLSSQSYRYDSLGRLFSYQKFDQASKNTNISITHDQEDRILSITDNQINEKFEYDKKGNTIQSNGKRIEYGLMDEPVRFNNQTIEYDKSGNLLAFTSPSQKRLTFSYSDNGRLKRVKVDDDIWEYQYDGLGRRIRKSNAQESTTFFWAGEKLLSEEHHSQNQIIIREYIYIDNDTPIGFRENQNYYWYQKDIRGAILQVHNDKGEIVWNASYSAFGEANITINKIKQPWRLSGHYYDDETGLYYNLSRFYNPYLQTYLSLDPEWMKYGSSNYSFAGNSPYDKIDTNGNWPEWLNKNNLLAAGIGIGAGALLAAAAPAILATLGVSAIAAESLTTLVAIGAATGFVSSASESIAKDLLNHSTPNASCAITQGVVGALFGLVLAPAVNLLSSSLSPLAKKLLPKMQKLKVAKPPALNASNKVKGIYGEHVTDVLMTEEGYTKLNGNLVQIGDVPRGTGIDGVWKKSDKFVITESKYGSSKLGMTKGSGKQMSDKWVGDRLPKEVGPQSTAIKKEMAKGKVEKRLITVSPTGSVKSQLLDKDAKIIKK